MPPHLTLHFHTKDKYHTHFTVGETEAKVRLFSRITQVASGMAETRGTGEGARDVGSQVWI